MPRRQRSAPVLGRSDVPIRTPLEFSRQPWPIPRCCAGGRAHSYAEQRLRGTVRAAALLLLGLWFFTNALTVCPQLHHWLHKDSNKANHECVVSHLKQSSLIAATRQPLITAPGLVTVEVRRQANLHHFPAFDYRLSPSRAPPLLSSSLAVGG